MVRRFELADLPQISVWYQDRKLPALTVDFLPPTGYIEPGVAAGFLYLTDSNMALLEGYVTNPRHCKRSCVAAIDEITAALLVSAREQGVQHILAFCSSRGIKNIALRRHRMREAGTYTLVTRELTPE